MRSTTKFGTARNNPFSEFKASCLLFCFILIVISCSIGYELVISTANVGLDFDDPIGEFIIYCLCSTGIILYALLRMHQLQISWKRIVGKFPKNYRWMSLCGLVLVLLLFSLGVGFLSLSLLSKIAPTFAESLLEDIDEADAGLSSVPLLYNSLEFTTYVIVAPIAEEFIFRGVLLHIWATKWKIALAIVLSSTLFGLLHLNPIGASIFGIIWTIFYIRTSNLFVPIVAHAMNNSVAFGASFLISLNKDLDSSVLTLDIVNELWRWGLLLVAVSAPFIINFIYRKWPSENATLPYFANAVEAVTERSPQNNDIL